MKILAPGWSVSRMGHEWGVFLDDVLITRLPTKEEADNYVKEQEK